MISGDIKAEPAKNIDQLLQEYDLTPESDDSHPSDATTGTMSGPQWVEQMAEMPGNDAESVWQVMSGVDGVRHTTPPNVEEMGEEIGHPGTKFYDGELEMEQVGKYAPFQIRGVHGEPGILDKQYRQEPVIRDSVDSIVEIQMAAERFVDPPEQKYFADERKHEEVVEWSRRMNMVFANLDSNMPTESGFDRYIADAAQSTTLFGFSPHEVVWRQPGWQGFDHHVPRKIPYRSVSTVDRWVMDNSHSRLLAIDFDASTSNGFGDTPQYTLPVQGSRLQDHKAVVSRLAARGANWEGVAPSRSTQHWIKFKQLLGQIAAATAQKYGVPTTFIKLDPSFFAALPNPTDTDNEAIQKVVNKLDIKQAVECAIVGLPGGLEADLQAPAGTMPDFEALIRYCDEMIAKPYSNEGSLLGHNQVGSYALAETQDNAFMRSAPMYNRVIMSPINGLIRLMAKQQFGILPAYPTMRFKLNSMHDAESFIEDMANMFAPNESITHWPEKVRKEVAKKMGMREDVFDLTDDELQRRILRRIQQMQDAGQAVPTVQESSFQDGEDEGEDDEDEGDPEGVEVEDMAEPIPESARNQEGFIPDRAEAVMDTAEERWSEQIVTILEDMQRAFTEQTDGVTGADRLFEATESLKDQYRDQLLEPIRQMGAWTASRGAEQLAMNFGVDLPVEMAEGDRLFGDLTWLDDRNKPQVEGISMALAEEFANRQAGMLRAQHQANMDTPKERQLSGLTKGGIALSLAKMTSTAYNAGRDQLIRDAQSAVSGSTLTIETDDGPKRVDNPEETMRAIRSSMLDANVCGPCRKLDNKRGGPVFTVGTDRYFAHKPPRKCITATMGKPRCRCIYIKWDTHGGEVIRRGIERAIA